MIIYKKNSEELVIPVGLGPNVSPITGYELQMKRVDSSTELQHVEPDAGYYGLYRVIVDPYELDSKTVDASTEAQVITSSKDGLFQVIVNPYTLESRSQTITQNGEYSFTPDNKDGLSRVDISVNVADIPAVVQTKSVTYTENGEYSVEPDQGYDGLSHVDVSVNVEISPELQEKTVDPSVSEITVEPDSGYDGLSSVTINPIDSSLDPDLSPENIKKDVEIFGVTGTYEGQTINNQSKTVDSSTASQSVTADNGYTGLGTVTVNPYVLQGATIDPWNHGLQPGYTFQIYTMQDLGVTNDGIDRIRFNEPAVVHNYTINPSTATQTFLPSQAYTYSGRPGDYFKTIICNAVDASIDPDIQPENIKLGVEILGVTGTYAGQSVNNQNKTVDSSTASQSVTADNGYTGLGTVTVNPYTTEADSSTLTQNGQYVFTPQNSDALSQVTIDVSVDGQSVNNQNKTVDSSTVSQSVTADNGYTGLGTVTVNPYMLDSKTVNPSTNQQIITSDADGLSQVTVNAMNLQVGTYNPHNWHGSLATVTPGSGYDGFSSLRVRDPYTGNLTVDSSTSQQVITPANKNADLFNTITVNPYTTEIDSSTLTANGTYTFTPQNADALSQVTIDVSVDGQSVNNQNKTVDSSTVSQSVTADNGYTGLGTVTVNPYTLDSSTVDPSINQIVITSNADGLSSVTVNAINAVDGFDTITQNGSYGFDGTHFGGDYINYLQIDVSVDTSVNNQNKTVNSSTVSQSITADNGYTGLGTVTVNPYTTEICSSTLTQNGQYVFTPTNVDAFSQVAINVNVDGQDMNRTTSITLDNLDSSLLWPVPQGSQGRLLNLGHLEKTRVTLGGINENFVVSTKEMLESDPDPDVGGWDFGHVVDGFVKIDTSVGSHIKTITYNVNSIISRDGFATSGPICTSTNAPNLEKISFPMSCYGDYSGYGVDFTGWFTPWKNDIEYEIDSTWFGSSDASVNLTYELGSHLVNLTLPRNYIGGEICYLGWASNLSAESVLTILQNLHVNVSQRPCVCTFYTGGLTVTDYPDGRIQTAYDTAVTNGWTIQNLTIQQPLYAPVDYIQSTGQTLNLGNTLGRYDAVYADYEMAAGDGGIFIGTDGTGAYKFGFGTDGQGNLYEHYGTSGVDTFYGAAAGLNTRYQGCMGIYTDDVGGWTWSDFSYGETYPAYNIDDYDGSGSNALRFADASNYGKVRSIKVYTNLWWGINVDFDSDYNITFTDQPLYNYEPVMRLSDNAYGLYETTTGTFYTAQGITGGMDPGTGMFECPDCGGTGEVDGDTCGTCGGTGYVDWDPNAGEMYECPDCGGLGEVDGDTCPTCGGSGYVDWDPGTGMFECPDCGGTGEVDGDTCPTCGGTGCVDWDPTE